MSNYSITLTKQGLRRESWDLDREGSVIEIMPTSDVFELLRYWHWEVDEIDDDYTLGDLVRLLQRVEGIQTIGPMLDCDIRAFLSEADLEPKLDSDEPLRFLEVYNLVGLTAYVEDPDRPDEPDRSLTPEEEAQESLQHDAACPGQAQPWVLYDCMHDDPDTGLPQRRRLLLGALHGRWVAPYSMGRDFHGWGRWDEPYSGYFAEHPEIDPGTFEGGHALHCRRLCDMLHYPLRYNPRVSFEPEGRVSSGEPALDTSITITFGEFVHAIFWEIGYQGSPEARDGFREALLDRVSALDSLR